MHVTLKAGVNELESLFAIGFLKRAPQRAECGRLGYNSLRPHSVPAAISYFNMADQATDKNHSQINS